MKRIIITLVAMLLISVALEAQRNQDTLYLKNGSIVYGKFIEIKSSRYKIKTAEGLLFTFTSDEIAKFVIGEKPKPAETKPHDPNGLNFGIESGLLLGSSESNFPIFFSFNPGMTYTYKTRQTLAMFSGVEMFDQFVVPIILEYRYNILKHDVSPFIYARGGGLIAIGGEDSSEDYKGGWTFGLGTGFRWPISVFESYIKFGFRYSYTVHTGNEYNYLDGSYFPCTFHAIFYRLEIKWGFKF